jgi:hypothetical protein
MTERKVIQIACSESSDGPTIVALCDDGTIWRHDITIGQKSAVVWRRLQAVPGAKEPQ